MFEQLTPHFVNIITELIPNSYSRQITIAISTILNILILWIISKIKNEFNFKFNKNTEIQILSSSNCYENIQTYLMDNVKNLKLSIDNDKKCILIEQKIFYDNLWFEFKNSSIIISSNSMNIKTLTEFITNKFDNKKNRIIFDDNFVSNHEKSTYYALQKYIIKNCNKKTLSQKGDKILLLQFEDFEKDNLYFKQIIVKKEIRDENGEIEKETSFNIEVSSYLSYDEIFCKISNIFNMFFEIKPYLYNISIISEKDPRITIHSSTQKTNKTFENTFYNKKIENEFIKDFDNFVKNEKIYKDKGLAYKRGYILESIPGIGKTTLVKLLAIKYNITVFTFTNNIFSKDSLIQDAFRRAREFIDNGANKYIILLEDFERCDIFKENAEKTNTLINEIDGISENNGRILIITTNDSTKILKDEALTRKGRIDKHIVFDYCDCYQLNKIIKFHYNSNYKFKNIKKITSAEVEYLISSELSEKEFIDKIELKK